VAPVLPAAEELSITTAQPGNEHVTAMFGGAAVAELDGAISGTVGILVGDDLVKAMQVTGSDLGEAIQPAFDAAASVLRASARGGRTVELDAFTAAVGEPFTVVPLIGSGIAGAVAISDATLAASLASVAPAPAGAPVPAATQTAATQPAEPTAAIADPAAAATTAAPEAAPATPGAANGTTFESSAVGATTPPATATAIGETRGIEMLHGVYMDVTVELGRTQLTVRELLALTPGTVLELDRAAGSPADLLVNGRLIARGEVVVVDEDFGLRITEIVTDGAVV
jgi:flagellar motor switch protein FliN/FliY